MKKVLIALDYDPSAQKVAESGYSVARAMKAEITLLHVIVDPVYYASPEYDPIMGFNGYLELGKLKMSSIEGLKRASLQFLDQSKKHLGDPLIKTRVAEGDFAEAILNTAKDLDADIIVMGSHSRKWIENIVMGSVTEKVLRHSTIPLFIIPTKKQK